MIKGASSMKKLLPTIIFLSIVFFCVPSITYSEEDRWDSDRLGIESGESYIELGLSES
jgi:hypothetical protein